MLMSDLNLDLKGANKTSLKNKRDQKRSQKRLKLPCKCVARSRAVQNLTLTINNNSKLYKSIGVKINPVHFFSIDILTPFLLFLFLYILYFY